MAGPFMLGGARRSMPYRGLPIHSRTHAAKSGSVGRKPSFPVGQILLAGYELPRTKGFCCTVMSTKLYR